MPPKNIRTNNIWPVNYRTGTKIQGGWSKWGWSILKCKWQYEISNSLDDTIAK